MNTFKKFGIAAAVSAVALTAGAAVAQDAAAAIETRVTNFEMMDDLWQPMLPMMRGEADAAAVGAAADGMKPLAEMIPALFEEDTRESDAETLALDGIWASKEDFNMKAAALVTALDAMSAAAASNDQRAIKTSIRDVGMACGNCHDVYKADE